MRRDLTIVGEVIMCNLRWRRSRLWTAVTRSLLPSLHLWNIYDDCHNNAGDDIIILCDGGDRAGRNIWTLLTIAKSQSRALQNAPADTLHNFKTFSTQVNINLEYSNHNDVGSSTPWDAGLDVDIQICESSGSWRCAQTRRGRIAHINLLIRSIIRLADELQSCEVEYIKSPFSAITCIVGSVCGPVAGRTGEGGEPITYFVRPTSHQKFACS